MSQIETQDVAGLNTQLESLVDILEPLVENQREDISQMWSEVRRISRQLETVLNYLGSIADDCSARNDLVADGSRDRI
jgi:hypothetical protein